MFGAPATPKATRDSWPRYMTTPTSASFPTDSVDSSHLPNPTPTKIDSFQTSPSATTPSRYHHPSSARPTALPSPSLSDSPYIGRHSLRTPFADHSTAPYSIQQQIDTSTSTSQSQQQQSASPPHETMPYPTTPSPQPYGINGSLLISEPHILQPAHDQCNPLLGSDVFMSAPLPKSRQALRPTLSHNGNGVYTTQPPSTWPRRMMPPTESNERTRSSTADTTMSPPHNPPSLLTTTAPTGSTYAAPPPPQQQSSRSEQISGQSGLSISRGEAHAADQSHPHHGHASSASSAVPQFGSSLPSSLPSNLHPSSSYAAPPPPSFATHSQAPPPPHTHYSDDVPYQPAQYDAIPSYSPWPAHSSLPSHSDLYINRPPPGYPHQPQGYWSQPTTKMDEPLLAPGELPAPRPPMSYAALIGEALLLAPPPHQLYVSEISDSIKRRYTYYRQNPSKVYNGVRHQTSMCKAFVKLPRPYGDQSGGARKWAIRAGCDTWFHSGGYHPPSSTSPSMSNASVKKSGSVGPAAGKAKSTARAKQLAIGTSTPPEPPRRRLSHEPFSPSSGQGGPSIGAAFDGTGRPTWNAAPATQAPPPGPPMYAMPHPSHAPHPSHGHYLPPPVGMQPYPAHGYQYVPIQQHHHQQMHAQHHPHQHQGHPMFVPVFGAYPHHSPSQQYMPTPVSAAGGQHQQGHGSQASEEWRYENEGKGEQGQGQRQEEYQHSSPGSMTSHHSNQSPPSM